MRTLAEAVTWTSRTTPDYRGRGGVEGGREKRGKRGKEKENRRERGETEAGEERRAKD